MQQLAVYLFTARSLYMFRVLSHPSSGVHIIVTAASGTGHSKQHSNSLPPTWPKDVILCRYLFTAK